MTNHTRTILVCLGLVLAGAAVANPLPDPPPLRTEAELREFLKGDQWAVRDAARQVAHAAHLHRDLIEAVLASPAVRARVYGVEALESLGDQEARDRLLKILADASQNNAVRIAAAESLAKLGDRRAIPLVREWRQELGGLQAGALDRVLRAYDDPLVFAPLITIEGGMVWFRFLLDDVASIAVCRYPTGLRTPQGSYQPVLTFDPADHATLLNAMQRNEEARVSMIVEDTYLVIELNDGHRVALNLDGEVVCYSDTTRWHHGEFFKRRMPELVAFVAARLAEAGKPSIGHLGPGP